MYIRLLYIYICFFNILFFHSSINRFISSHIFISSIGGVRPGFQPMKNCLITWRAKATTTRTATCHWISSGIILPNIWGIMNTVKKNCDSINLVEGSIFFFFFNQFHGNNHGFRWRFSLTPIQSEPGVVKHQGQVEVVDVVSESNESGEMEKCEVPSGHLLHSYWTLPFIVDFPIKNCDFP